MEQLEAVSRLIASYRKLPGIGTKTAERLAYATLSFTREEIDDFISALANVSTNIHKCEKCGMLIDTPFCPICDNPSRDSKTLMVLTSYRSILSFEKTGKYQGLYFVLGGSISPIKGIKAQDIRIPELIDRIKNGGVKEVILATDSTMEGEITAQYIYKALASYEVLVSRLAYGLPIGADLEYVDQQTIERSLKGRLDMKGE